LRRLADINRYTVAFDNGEVHSYSNESVVKLRVALTQVRSKYSRSIGARRSRAIAEYS
jgi:hypothetical protein